MNTIEQIVICKFMLFSYIYHHRKVRAGEGLLGKGLLRLVDIFRKQGKSDEGILEEFLTFTDCSLDRAPFDASSEVFEYASRIRQRLLPREVFGFVGSKFSHAEGGLLRDFISVLLDKGPRTGKENPRDRIIAEFHQIMGQELCRLDTKLGPTPQDALWKTGAWLDAPKSPKFENIDFLIGAMGEAIRLSEIFPIQYWIQAYESHRYYVRVFAFSEYLDLVKQAARAACEYCIGVKTDAFYEAAERKRK